MLLKKNIFFMLFTVVLFGESEFKKPKSFKDYKEYTLNSAVMVFVAPKLTKDLKIKDVKGKHHNEDADEPIKTMFLRINGQQLKLTIDSGASDDFSFAFKYKGRETMIEGEVIFISQSGTLYISSRGNQNYEVNKKFTITENVIKEVKQAFSSVDLECKTSALATLYTKQGDKGTVVARIPKGSTLKVLVNTFTEHSSEYENNSFSKNYLVKTSFGLVGWVTSSAGYMQRKGKPLGCLMFMGD